MGGEQNIHLDSLSRRLGGFLNRAAGADVVEVLVEETACGASACAMQHLEEIVVGLAPASCGQATSRERDAVQIDAAFWADKADSLGKQFQTWLAR